ncbi:MAG: hypothetical protein KFW21_04750 [Spirochaetota bacterium]|nr:hypothetical protein [Spirochaetota bacterium]
MQLILKIIFFIVLGLKLSIPSYSFYDIYGDILYLYDVEFTGEVIISSKYFSYTNTNAQFNFDYSLSTSSEFTDTQQIVIDWKFSPLTSSTLPSIFIDLWQSYIDSKTDNIAYIVKLESDHFLVFDKNGKRHPLGYVFEVLFPIIDMKNNQYNQTYSLNVPSELETDLISMVVSGWDFFKISRALNSDPLILLETNIQLINDIYSTYAYRNNNNIPTVFWMQNINILQANRYKQIKHEATLTGMYFLELDEKILSKSIIISKVSVELPYQYQNFKVPFNLKLEGKFDINLKKEADIATVNNKHYSNSTSLNNDKLINENNNRNTNQ